MTRLCSARLLVGVAASLLLLTAGAYGAVVTTYRGRTSQHELISFRISHHRVRALQFRIDVTCQTGHIWRLHDFRFPPIRIVRSRFDRRFNASSAKAMVAGAVVEVKGRVFRRRVRGSISEKASVGGERHCRGQATFDLHR
jgi:hypothetical protein